MSRPTLDQVIAQRYGLGTGRESWRLSQRRRQSRAFIVTVLSRLLLPAVALVGLALLAAARGWF